jgi:hypothetical protein
MRAMRADSSRWPNLAALQHDVKFANDIKEISRRFDIVTHCCAAPIAGTD